MKEAPFRPGQIAEISFSQEWLEVLNRLIDEKHIADSRTVLVTDATGVEVQALDGAEPHVDSDRFPLKVFCLSPPKVESQPPNVALNRAYSHESRNSGNSDDASPTQILGARNKDGKVTTEILFEDVWPGILQIKLHAVVGRVADQLDVRRGIVATDKTGVEIDLSCLDRFPDEDRFPLKLHFQAQGSTTRQNLNECFDGSETQTSSFGEDNAKGNDKEVRQHSTELQLGSLLNDVIFTRMRLMGIPLDNSRSASGHTDGYRKPAILVTDRIGVQIDPSEGVPDHRRFPLKFHVDNSSDDNMGAKGSLSSGRENVTAAIKDLDRKARKFFKRSSSKLSGV